ncbi:hypothetical protein H8B02_40590 [Bradyrhizobium sp. Pear77]|uniref:hypothetical protein n=1 Tax=Bradyrhizobium altum TaxID=1571202 RepID=UPI001E566049|nr:hypothetical protein [Bradyrhizobium altum]MCC8959481.1 hypothetical protein [Bradyrhizobium altum]
MALTARYEDCAWMRVTFDSNAWEKIFAPRDEKWIAIREALLRGRIFGFISEAAFRIEAIRKKERSAYFAQSAMDVQFPFDTVVRDGVPYLRIMLIGPDNNLHPGLPDAQAEKLSLALDTGIRVLRGVTWLGLPSPLNNGARPIFEEDKGNQNEREQCQIAVMERIEARGVGKAIFDAIGGWQAVKSENEKALSKSCAEWADAELVAAHIAYGNDIICTDDHGRASGLSIFDMANRNWLSSEYGVRFITLENLG